MFTENILKIKSHDLPLERKPEQTININIQNLVTSGMY